MDCDSLCIALKNNVSQHLIVLCIACVMERRPLSGQNMETEWFPIDKSVRKSAFYLPISLICMQNISYEKLGWTQRSEE